MIISRTPQKDFCFLSPARGSWKVIWLPQFQDKAVWCHWNQQHEQEEKEESDLLKKCFLLSHMDRNNLWRLSELWPEKALVHLLTHDTSVSVQKTQSGGTKCTQITMGPFPVKCQATCPWAFYAYTCTYMHTFGLLIYSKDD